MILFKDPVCDPCKDKKVGCPHRAIRDKGGKVVIPAEVDPSSVTVAFSGKSRKVYVTIKSKSDPEKPVVTNDQPKLTSSEAPLKRSRREGAGKRKIDDSVNEGTLSGDTKRVRVRATAKVDNNKKSTQEGQKPVQNPRQEQPVLLTETAATTSTDIAEIMNPEIEQPMNTNIPSSPVCEPQTQPQIQKPPMKGAVENSIDIAWHRYMTRKLEEYINDTTSKWEALQETIQRAEAQWNEVSESMATTNGFIAKWVFQFTRGNVPTP